MKIDQVDAESRVLHVARWPRNRHEGFTSPNVPNEPIQLVARSLRTRLRPRGDREEQAGVDVAQSERARYGPPSRSCTLAPVTATARIKPNTSTTICRLRPLVRFAVFLFEFQKRERPSMRLL